VLLLAAFGSLGNIFGPLLAVPFVSHEYSADSFSPLVFYPFVILASLFVANAINLSIQYAIGLGCPQCHDSEASMTEKKEDHKEPKRQSQLLWLVVPGMGLVDFFVRASDTIPAYLLPSIGIESRLLMAASHSNIVLTVYDVSRTISKLLASLLMKRVSVLICVPMCLVMTSIWALFLYLWGLTSVPAYFMIVMIMGMFTGPTATLLVVWCNEYITVDGYAMSVWQVAENVGILSSVLVGGIVFDVYGSLPALLINFIVVVIGCVAFVILQFVISTSCKFNRNQHQLVE
jgi:predicted MFS family arabinose efflux permease